MSITPTYLRPCRAAFFAAALLASCTTENYDSGDGTLSYLTTEFAEVHADAGKQTDYFTTDDGTRVYVDNPFSPSWAQKADSLYRTLVYYDKVGTGAEGNHTMVFAFAEVPVLDVAPTDKIGEMKTDPVKFESIWLSASGKYLNLGIYVKTGQTDNGAAGQTVGAALDSISTSPDGAATAHIRLYHDQNGVPEYYSSRQYLSIRTADIPADSVYITINTYDGEVTKRLKTK